MAHYILDQDSDLIGFLEPDGLSLTPAQVDWAVALGQSAPTEAQRWQTYLNALALIGFAQWLKKNSPDLNLHSDWLSGVEPLPTLSIPIADAVTSLQRVQVDDFQVCLTMIEIVDDGAIAIPQSILNASTGSNSPPHIFVLMEVMEEFNEVRVYGYLRHDQLLQHQQVSALDVDEEQNYLVPLSWFDPAPESLLLLLRCAHPGAIALPSQAQSTPTQTASSLVQNLAQQAMNVGAWLNNQLDHVAQELSWVLLPAPSLNPGLLSDRFSNASPVEQFDALLTTFIQQKKIELPAHARGAYRDFQWDALPLRMYVVAWEEVTDNTPTWCLLLFLGAQATAMLPPGIQLTVRDADQVLESTSLSEPSQDYLYACVIGELHEQFWATLQLPNGASTTLPPFSFERE
ncbi:DUF1822 family protein [Leptolyngbya sp. AN02str]|uniref:DUF1822 family protein n=1 Tax=Leptolyngbya sp. AN02str TaxID=3423363 RepID=UPI003D32179E